MICYIKLGNIIYSKELQGIIFSFFPIIYIISEGLLCIFPKYD